MILKDKVIIITGENSLLGKEMVKDVTEKGGITICPDIPVETNLSLNTLNLEISSKTFIVKSYELVNSFYGKIDGLVNNA